MKTATKELISAAAAVGVIVTVAGAQAAPAKNTVRHPTATHRRPQHVYVFRRPGRRVIVNTRPVPTRTKIPATPIPQTPGASPATPPIAPGSSGDTRTPMTPPGVGGTGVPGGPGTQP